MNGFRWLWRNPFPLLTAVLLLTCLAPARTQTPGRAAGLRETRRADCFPLERLPDALRPRAEEMLLKLLDSEALYTVVGGIKPMSSGFGGIKIRLESPDTAEVENLRRILSVFRCGDSIVAGLLPFHQVYAGERYFEAVIFYQPAVERIVATYPDYFAPYGITPSAPPMDVALIVENDPSGDRNRGLGYLYGYPRYAVDFFVEAAQSQARNKKLVPRGFFQIPTFASPTGRFVYAVPKGHLPRTEDIALREAAHLILAEYRRRRERYIGPGKPGIVELLRDWFDNGSGRCAPENARYR